MHGQEAPDHALEQGGVDVAGWDEMTRVTIRREPTTPLSLVDVTGDDAGTLADTGAAAPTILFAAQWRTTGRTNLIRRDADNGGTGTPRFDGLGNGCGVYAAGDSGLSGFPTTNVLRVPSAAGDIDGSNLRISHGPPFGSVGFGPLPVGGKRYFRLYMANTCKSGSAQASSHPVESNGGQIEWAFPRSQLQGTDQWSWSFAVRTAGPRGTDNKAWEGGTDGAVTHPRNTVFRFEWMIYRTSATEFMADVRVYDSGGTLLCDGGDFQFNNNDVLNTTTFVIGSATNFESFQLGSNKGGFDLAGDPPQYWQAAVAVSDEDWLGPYDATIEANWDA